MYSITYPWQSFRVHLPDLDQLLRINIPTYVGNSADRTLKLHFSEEPTDTEKASVEAIWQNMSEEIEAAKFTLDANREAAVISAKTAMLSSDMTTWIPAERKIFMCISLTAEDKDALIAKQGV